jgi:hypothetical protein
MPDVLDAAGLLGQNLDASDITYVPSDLDTELRIRPYLAGRKENQVVIGEATLQFGGLKTTSLGHETAVYANAVQRANGIEFPEGVMDYIEGSRGNLLKGGKEIVQSLAEKYITEASDEN